MQNPISSWTARERLALAFVAATLATLGLGAWIYRRQMGGAIPPPLLDEKGRPESVTLAAGGEATPSPGPTASPPTQIVVYVTGAVRNPGVYTLRSGQRLFQAIHRAGGFTAKADREALNLADHLRDADQVHVPKRASPAPPPIAPLSTAAGLSARGRTLGRGAVAPAVAPAPPSGAGPKFKNPGDGIVRLNTATQEELMQLPGVGPSTAAKILEYRQQAGRFSEIAELKNVRGIGEKKFARMEPFVRLQ